MLGLKSLRSPSRVEEGEGTDMGTTTNTPASSSSSSSSSFSLLFVRSFLFAVSQQKQTLEPRNDTERKTTTTMRRSTKRFWFTVIVGSFLASTQMLASIQTLQGIQKQRPQFPNEGAIQQAQPKTDSQPQPHPEPHPEPEPQQSWLDLTRALDFSSFWNVSISNNKNNKNKNNSNNKSHLPYRRQRQWFELSYGCPGCRWTAVNRRSNCGQKVDDWIRKQQQQQQQEQQEADAKESEHKNQTIREQKKQQLLWQYRAYLQTSQEHPNCYKRCHPEFCHRSDPNSGSSSNSYLNRSCSHNGNDNDNTNNNKTIHSINNNSSNNNINNKTCLPKRVNKYWYFNDSYPNFHQARTYGPLSSIPVQSRYQSHYKTVKELEQSSFNITQYMHDAWWGTTTASYSPQSSFNSTSNSSSPVNQEPTLPPPPPPQRRTDIFVEYNPTLTPLPKHFAWKDNNIYRDNPITYLASFRVTSWQACFPWKGYTEDFPREQLVHQKLQNNYLGLALLRADLTIVTDVVVDLETSLLGGRNLKQGSRYMDYRLHTFNDQMYLNVNGPPVHLITIWIEQPNSTDPQQQPNTTTASTTSSSRIAVENLYGNGLKLWVDRNVHEIKDDAQKSGKNFALFQPRALSQTTGEVVVEYNIHGSRRVQQFQPPYNNNNIHNQEKANNTTDQDLENQNAVQSTPPIRWGNINVHRMQATTTVLSDNYFPPPSFATVDELWFPNPVFKPKAHGGACCVELPLSSSMSMSLLTGKQNRSDDGEKNNQVILNTNKNHEYQDSKNDDYVLVGVGHTKITHQGWMKDANQAERLQDQPPHQYVSFLYALDPTTAPHYRVVARSGYFCWPLVNATRSQQEEGEQEEENTNARILWTRLRTLNLKRVHFENCPEISFVSNIVQHATEPNQVIISYGINDCTSRVVVVEKKELYQILFHGPDYNNDKNNNNNNNNNDDDNDQ